MLKMIKKGRKTLEWEKVRRELKVEFEQKGITSCELRFSGCWFNNALSFAHTDKRRYLSDGELRIVVLACIPCHDIVERWPRLKMKEYLEGVIKSRELNLSEI